MRDSYYGELSVIGMRGCENFVDQVDYYLKEWRSHDDGVSFITRADCPRFGSGEGKGMLHSSMRGHDVYIISDCFNHGVTYKMFGQEVPMSPDDHFADLKRVIAAMGGKARRITVIMPMLYEGRQHKRSARESLDCSIALQELVNMGVQNIITFDAHDPRVSNAIPLTGFDNVRPTYQMLKALVRDVPDISLSNEDTIIISPDEGAISRTMYYASVMGLDLGMFYKRRDYSIVVDGKKVDIPSYRVKVGQTISLKENSKGLVVVKAALDAKLVRPEYLSYDENNMVGTLVRIPERDEFLSEINEQLIVEFYNR